ncbi:stage V sporulation protein R [Ruminiclostridium sufflavum DSM 19573]|uniref:Stage V sporulation protein R n=1 Tax=Ruminiclostridium sufflavum DSM 19573 TaxID=1121337 RepID=A0A318XLE7_9FIRM|nr:SpoVR family protein [Ruminiclostridium sufflavum]PYG88448.1 stage V sporulation protein R [Ruminiclostridium sufflavum DSM 19573]
MADFSILELEYWNERIEGLARNCGLDYYNQEFEIINYEDMIGYESYIGMPSHYPHWSYGKSYERIKTLHKYNLTGLPYEMVINSDPCIAYLMKDNSLLVQVLTIAHVYAHNDFFKNNRLFKLGTKAEYAIEMFKNHANRIREYISDPSIGYARVEKILNAAHAVKLQTERVAEFQSGSEKKEEPKFAIKENKKEFPNLERYSGSPAGSIDKELQEDLFLSEPQEDILKFIAENGCLQDWEKDILSIVREEAQYFIPQIETKIMNEGWASFWHYNILNKLELPQNMHLEFLRRHNEVIRPLKSSINPYYIGFKMFEDLYNKFGSEKIFEVRNTERDQSFIRRYLTQELCTEMNLFEYVTAGNDYMVSEVSDEEGWKVIRETLCNTVGIGSIPTIVVSDWNKKDNTLMLKHEFDGRELELGYAYETLKHIVDLWNGKTLLTTQLEGKQKSINCDEAKRISLYG